AQCIGPGFLVQEFTALRNRTSKAERRAPNRYQPLQSNLNPPLRHLMQPLNFARSCDSPHRGQVVASGSVLGAVALWLAVSAGSFGPGVFGVISRRLCA